MARKQTEEIESQIAKFTNFSDETFVAHWDGKAYTFEPKQEKVMQAYKAMHFAKALANRELLRKKIDPKTGQIMRNLNSQTQIPTPVYEVPNGDSYTSPKKPEDVPEFAKRVKMAFQMVSDGADDKPEEKGQMNSEMGEASKPKDTQIASFPDDPDDEEFAEKPKEEDETKK